MSDPATELIEKIDCKIKACCVSMAELDKLEEQISEYIDESIEDWEGRDDCSLSDIRKELENRRDRLDLSSGITDEVVGISKRILGFGAAGTGLALAFYDKISQISFFQKQLIGALSISLLELVFISLLVLIMHLYYQRYRYPFLLSKEIGNFWQYYYYTSLSDDTISYIGGLSNTRKEILHYMKNYLSFFEKLKDESEKEKLRGEIQQYFLFIYYQAYSNQFSINIANTFLYGLFASVSSFLFMTLYSICS
jgi:hypothetical protein